MRSIFFLCVLSASLMATGCSLLPNSEDLSELQPPIFMDVFPPDNTVQGPTSKANIKYRYVAVGDTLSFDASESINRYADGALSYAWQVLEKPTNSMAMFANNTAKKSEFTVDVAGRYRLKLQVQDDNGLSDSFEILLSTDHDDLPRVSFIVIGDSGHGNDGQYRVGKSIATLCKEIGCDFILGLGDNIYNAGVTSKTDLQFQEKFEKPFADIQLPFYLILGNHDTSGIYAGDGGLNIRGDIQVEYSRWSGKPSIRWQMPTRFYHFGVPVDQPLVDIYALDTTLLTSPYDPLPRYQMSKMYQRQSAWLANQKSQSKALWQLAMAHHPYLSNGRHGNAGSYDEIDRVSDHGVMERIAGGVVKRFVEEQVCGAMDLYIAGHDHSLQYLKSTPGCGGTEFIVSGAASAATELKMANNNPSFWQQGDVLGFFHIEIIGERMTISAYSLADSDVHAVEQYRRTLVKQ